MPRQLGPTMRTLALRAVATSFSCSALPSVADFAEAAGEHERERDAGLPALLDRAGATCGADSGDQRDVAGLRHGGEIGIAGEALDLLYFGLTG